MHVSETTVQSTVQNHYHFKLISKELLNMFQVYQCEISIFYTHSAHNW